MELNVNKFGKILFSQNFDITENTNTEKFREKLKKYFTESFSLDYAYFTSDGAKYSCDYRGTWNLMTFQYKFLVKIYSQTKFRETKGVVSLLNEPIFEIKKDTSNIYSGFNTCCSKLYGKNLCLDFKENYIILDGPITFFYFEKSLEENFKLFCFYDGKFYACKDKNVIIINYIPYEKEYFLNFLRIFK